MPSASHTPQTPLDVLKAARELIADPAKWTRRAGARDATGEPIDSASDDAVCFCVIGATCHVDPVGGGYDADHQLAATLGFEYVSSLGGWNDAPERTHAEVLDLFDRTIARLEAEVAHD